MTRSAFIALTAVVAIACGDLHAQRPVASLDTTVIRIGEQAVLRLELPLAAGGTQVTWPIMGDTLSRHIEVVDPGRIDTLKGADGRMERSVRNIRITSFDTGFWAIPPQRFIIHGTPVETGPLLLEVRGVELDSAGAVRDIKDIIELPFSLAFWLEEHAPWIGGTLALAALVLFLWKRRKRPVRQTIEATPGTPAPLHERTLAALRELEAQRVWQQGDHKRYQSQLTDLLRSYIEERYAIPALERTTDELLHALRVSPLDREQQVMLANLLHLADLVKFAKATPAPAENERSMTEAIRFVERTADHRVASAHVPVTPTPERHAPGS
jgi:hypothetical protein